MSRGVVTLLEQAYNYIDVCVCVCVCDLTLLISSTLREQTRPVILFRMRTGHNRLNAHMYSKFKVGESEMCPCNADIMTAEHQLAYSAALRRDMWPELKPLRDKLCGYLEELKRTAATGISA